ncbi:hypothetical protein SAMN04487948_102235 [Halogranum amylolyticum]|uniref:Uncharacterized protein n=1 Tax=Halogranum amylolyticum TaxID=660520 RepID=A0A1H8PDU9_9EURY|nr:hypothetical protein [Halogranum amylolyticum]SEO39854.1 hypothetical protein SAMN04487948_102235 [Halogranum amylolyticum]
MESTRPGILGAIRIDLARLHATWMELLFPRQLDPSRVLGKWHPETTMEKTGYVGWATVGLPLVVFGYPLLLAGMLIRFHARRLDSAGTRLGVLGVGLLSLVVWGGLTAVAHLRFSQSGFLAVLAASVVATVAAALAVVFGRVGGRATSVFFADPTAMTALFLPPVVAALYAPSIASVVFPISQSLAVRLLDTVFSVGGLDVLLRQRFDLRGVAYVAMWFGLAVPLGWLFGVVVTLADVVRPRTGRL